MFRGPKPLQNIHAQSKVKIFINKYFLTNPTLGSFSQIVQVHCPKIFKQKSPTIAISMHLSFKM